MVCNRLKIQYVYTNFYYMLHNKVEQVNTAIRIEVQLYDAAINEHAQLVSYFTLTLRIMTFAIE